MIWIQKLLAALLMLTGPSMMGQQVNDPDFKFSITKPSHVRNSGPRVCIDSAHNNRHTLEGIFAPFVSMLAADGYRVSDIDELLTGPALKRCDLLIIGNAHARGNRDGSNWPYPHQSAFAREEIDALLIWVRSGGRLLLFIDHSPAAGEASDLGVLLGVSTLNAWSYNSRQGISPEIFRRSDGLFSKHPVAEGRSASERIDALAIYGACAFFLSEQFKPIVGFGAAATGWIDLGETGQKLTSIPDSEWPRYPLKGWTLVGAREWSKGRVVVFGDATACTAQLQGPERRRVGMNEQTKQQNALFCLSTVRWLSGALDRVPAK